MKKWLFASIGFLSACNGNVPILPDPFDAGETSSSSASSSSSTSSSSGGDGSGTRLRRYVYTSPDGLLAHAPGKFYDTLLERDCVPSRTSSGLQCAPFGHRDYNSSGSAFADSACTEPAEPIQKPCGPQKYLQQRVSGPCIGIDVKVFVFEESPLPTAYKLENGACVAVATPSQFEYYKLVGEADYATFAPLELKPEGN